MIVLDGEKLAKEILINVKKKLQGMERQLHLAIIQTGDRPDSNGFIKMKIRAGQEIGVKTTLYKFDERTQALRARVEGLVQELNASRDVDGILIQLPLVGMPKEGEQEILNLVSSDKDVDVLGVDAIGHFRHNENVFVYPPIVGAVKTFFDSYKISYQTSFIALVGGGKLVGSILNTWFKRRDEDVSHMIITKNYGSKEHLQKLLPLADTIITGVSGESNAEIITGDMVKEGAVVIDAGFFRIGERRVGNVHFESVSKKVSYITPVPGGVGPLTVAMVYYNLALLASYRG